MIVFQVCCCSEQAGDSECCTEVTNALILILDKYSNSDIKQIFNTYSTDIWYIFNKYSIHTRQIFNRYSNIQQRFKQYSDHKPILEPATHIQQIFSKYSLRKDKTW